MENIVAKKNSVTYQGLFIETMARLEDALNLLNILIHSIVDGMVKVNKETIFVIQIFLQNAQEKYISCSLNHNFDKRSYNNVVMIPNLFLFRIMPFFSPKLIVIISEKLFRSLNLVQEHV